MIDWEVWLLNFLVKFWFYLVTQDFMYMKGITYPTKCGFIEYLNYKWLKLQLMSWLYFKFVIICATPENMGFYVYARSSIFKEIDYLWSHFSHWCNANDSYIKKRDLEPTYKTISTTFWLNYCLLLLLLFAKTLPIKYRTPMGIYYY